MGKGPVPMDVDGICGVGDGVGQGHPKNCCVGSTVGQAGSVPSMGRAPGEQTGQRKRHSLALALAFPVQEM